MSIDPSDRAESKRSASRQRRLARLVGVALGALAVVCSSYAAPISNDAKLHLAAAPEDFKALTIGNEIGVREDGRRTPQSSEYFEWWYFDGLFDDGTVFVVWFGDNWLYGSHKRAVSIDLTPPGKPTRHIVRTFDDPGAFSSDHADVQLGPHSFKGDLETYAIHVDATDTGGVGCDLTLRRRVASYRPGTGYIEAGDRFFAWLVAVPEGAVAGTLTADGVTRQVTGSGYHEHNWGNVSPANLFENWWWGAAKPATRSSPPISMARPRWAGPGFHSSSSAMTIRCGSMPTGPTYRRWRAAPYAIPIRSMSAPSPHGSPTPPLMEVGPISRFPIAS
jgi:hypothetical protein